MTKSQEKALNKIKELAEKWASAAESHIRSTSALITALLSTIQNHLEDTAFCRQL